MSALPGVLVDDGEIVEAIPHLWADSADRLVTVSGDIWAEMIARQIALGVYELRNQDRPYQLVARLIGGDVDHELDEWAGTALDAPGSYLPDALGDTLSSPSPFAPWTSYQPGRHVLAFTSDECAAVQRLADEQAHEPARPRHGLVRYLPIERTPWLHSRLAGICNAANRTWWRLPVQYLTGETIVYGPGDEFPLHDDRYPGGPGVQTVTIVVLLNDRADYHGGDLRLRCWPDHSVPTVVDLEQGAVAVFPSTTLHEVTRIEAGTRHVLVCWAHAASPWTLWAAAQNH